ncbi:hypothetical protein RND71_009649 [Anisodus tanguticus]|uniref:Uncharacterized protein n=1 Tax=Anisodus tanguticus TaxID=243964 RepID=A0AAE1SIF8_9SOLA|nr:hypothetical protein RND71_009649 [Anisodus tanguticus]
MVTRVLCLFGCLFRFTETIALNTTDAVVHKHTPYIIILVKIAEEWAHSHGGNLPSTREEKRRFKDLIKSKMITMDEENYKEASYKSVESLGWSLDDSNPVFSGQWFLFTDIAPALITKILFSPSTNIHS